MRAFLIAMLMVFPLSTLAHAGQFSLHGFIQGNYAPRISGEGPNSDRLLLGEERTQLELEARDLPAGVGFFAEAGFFHDDFDGEWDKDLRELYADYADRLFHVRVGRQILTWGIADLLFLNDLFPKNWTALFYGRPLEYMKEGSDALKIDLYPRWASVEVVASFFREDRLPGDKRFFFFNPLSRAKTAGRDKPGKRLGDVEVAARVSRYLLGVDTCVYGYYGFFRSPGMRPLSPQEVTFFFPRLAVYGFSIQGSAVGGVVGMEASYYDSLDDRTGTDPVIPNSQTRFVLNYQKQVWEEFTVGVQAYGEYMHHYGRYRESVPPGFRSEDRFRPMLTLRLTQFVWHQTLRLSFFAFYGPEGGDSYLIPEVKYNVTDQLWIALGANIFSGERRAFFGQFDRNVNIYSVIRYEF